MRVYYGDLWDNHPTELVVVPANIGWKTGGDAVMGAGVAKQAADRFPDLPQWWGFQCQRFREDTPVTMHPHYRIILFPTKPLNEDMPWMSWKDDADAKLIWRSAAQLAAFAFDDQTISVPLVGCGKGRLSTELVLPILKTFLNHHRFQLVATQRERPLVEGIVIGAWENWLLVDDPRPDDDGNPAGTHFLLERN